MARHIPQKWSLSHRSCGLRREYSAKYDSFTIIHQNLCLGVVRVDTGHTIEHGTNRILTHLQFHDNSVIRCYLRLHIQAQDSETYTVTLNNTFNSRANNLNEKNAVIRSFFDNFLYFGHLKHNCGHERPPADKFKGNVIIMINTEG